MTIKHNAFQKKFTGKRVFVWSVFIFFISLIAYSLTIDTGTYTKNEIYNEYPNGTAIKITKEYWTNKPAYDTAAFLFIVGIIGLIVVFAFGWDLLWGDGNELKRTYR